MKIEIPIKTVSASNARGPVAAYEAVLPLVLAIMVSCGPQPNQYIKPTPETCCQCLTGIDCLTGQPTYGQCMEHIGDSVWEHTAVTDPTCLTDPDQCETFCP